jgi:hypothetical protein
MLLIAPLAIVGMVIFATLGGWIVMSLWNWLLPPLFAWPRISFWQGLGLLALCRILFGGSGIHMGRSDYRRRMRERWERMTPEERERMRQGWRGRWGFVPPAGDSPAD